MTSKEIVERTLEFTRPERLARSFPRPWGSDFANVGPTSVDLEADWKQVGDDRWERRDAWGNTWARTHVSSSGEVVRGALEDIHEVRELPLPDLHNPERYGRARAQMPELKDRFIRGSLPGFTFNVSRYIRRIEIYMMDLHLHHDEIEILHDRVDEILLGMIDMYGKLGCDGVMFCEDWGTQLGLMVHPNMWREIYKPRFRKLCQAAHERSLKVLMHSCGRITDIIPDLIEVGVDCLQFDQQQVHGLDNLATYAGRVTYWCPVDIQAVLRTGVEADIRAWARQLVEKLWCGGRGGFIGGFYGDEPSIGVKPEWQAWACEEFINVGVRKSNRG